ncbi:MAG: toxin [Gammaproteobacteria bacterium RBG_16_51_14]|nr:MAG: toxin [Gammaproteobacteria bacterium RBG_16_51_14]
MKPFDWNPVKNQQVIKERGVSFEDVIFSLQGSGLLDDIKHPNQRKYPDQRVFVVDIDGYAHLVPYVETEEVIFLKTVIPSRKATKQYLGGIND